MITKIRLAKIISSSGKFSRRTAEQLILTGQVSINNTVVDSLFYPYKNSDIIKINNKILSINNNKLMVVLLNKPKGYLVSKGDPFGRPTIYDLLPQKYCDLNYIGRLDISTEGLVVLTNSSPMINIMCHPKYSIKREYIVKVLGNISTKHINTLNNGITVNGISYTQIHANIINKTKKYTLLKLTLREGKKREIRITMKYLGYPVKQLIRIKFGPFLLEDITLGKIVLLSQQKLNDLIQRLPQIIKK